MAFLIMKARNRFMCIVTRPHFREEWNTVKMMRETTRQVRDVRLPATRRTLMASWNDQSGTQGL